MTATGARSPAAEPPEAYLVRFKHQLETLWPEGGRLGLAVSGGPDSLALLLLAEVAIPDQFEVATVDHGLRPESANECAMVARVCAERRIPCEVLNVTVGDGNLQANARAARYSALASWASARSLSAVATAHHEDDQAETLIMRLNRGSGVSGLAGVRRRGTIPGSDIPLIRPLLIFSRWALEKTVDGAGLVPVSDPSNSNARFDRARIRGAMEDRSFLDPAAISWSAHNLARADDALEWAAGLEWDERVTVSENEVRYRPRAPQEVAFRVVDRITSLLGSGARGLGIDRLLDQLHGGKGGNLAGVLATVEDGQWVFRPEPPRRTG